MHRFVSFNHEILPAREIKINPISSAGLYGKGVFTTIAIYDEQPFLWEKHWRRLKDNARKLGVDLSDFTEQKTFQSLEQIIQKNDIRNARCRLTFFDESPSKIWPVSDKQKTGLLIQTAEQKKSKQHISVMLSRFSVNSKSPLAGVKSCNYLENIMALDDAKKDGFDEVIRINERDEIVSAGMANIFWFEYADKKLYTPSLKTGCLAGTIREFLKEKFEVIEVEKEINSFFRDAEYLFLTSSGINIVQAADFENEIKFAQNRHELTQTIANALKDGVRE